MPIGEFAIFQFPGEMFVEISKKSNRNTAMPALVFAVILLGCP